MMMEHSLSSGKCLLSSSHLSNLAREWFVGQTTHTCMISMVIELLQEKLNLFLVIACIVIVHSC